MRFWIVFGTKVCVQKFRLEEFEVLVVLMRNQAGENNVDGGQSGEFESRPTMRALGRSASTKINQGWDWNRQREDCTS